MAKHWDKKSKKDEHKNTGAPLCDNKGYKSTQGSGGRFAEKRDGRRDSGMPAYDAASALTGRLSGNAKGFAFFVNEAGGDDLFIPAKALHGAMHGDTVEVVKTGENRGSGEAEVVKILERGFSTIVGTYQKSGNFGFVLPDNTRISKDIYIPSERSMGAYDGQKVVCEIADYPDGRNPIGQITEILGKDGERGVDVLSVIRSYGLYEKFPKEVESEARQAPDRVREKETEGRKDFRDDLVITIDGDDSKDFDDAVCVKRDGNAYKLYVHIADVAHYVAAQSKLDKEAFKRGTSVYLCDRVLPMLPKELSNGICSLNEGEDRLTMSVVMDIDNEGNVIKHKICEGVIRSKHRMTYKNTAAILDGDAALCETYADVVPMLQDMDKLAQLLLFKRRKRGCIEFDLSESHIEIGEDGRVKDITRYPVLKSNQMIEEFMLAANETVAEHFAERKAPFVFRAHETPSLEKTQTLVNFLSALGITFRGDVNAPKPGDFSGMLASLDEKVAPVVNRVTLRSMMKATYEPKNVGHFGLAAPFYCHFTSPIRRYPDLLIHRIMKDYFHNGESAFKKYAEFVGEASKRSSEREKLAENAERDVDDIKKAEYMSERIGNRYDGVVSGVTEWGIFVELDNSVEGLIRMGTLPGGDYVYNRDLMRLDNNRNSYRIGDKVKIIVDGVEGSKVSFKLDEEAMAASLNGAEEI